MSPWPSKSLGSALTGLCQGDALGSEHLHEFVPGFNERFGPFFLELGKVLAQHIIAELESEREPTLGHDSSTNNLIRRYRKLKEAL